MESEVVLTTAEVAMKLLSDFAAQQKQREELIPKLKEERANIDAALVALGATRYHKRKPGRPTGSRNRKAEVEA